jgi:hypothetical protein
MGKRFGLFINVNGVKVAFTEAQKAQVENKRVLDSFLWICGNNPWLIKGVIDTQVNVNYDSTGIKEYTDILNMTLNWDTEAESVKRVRSCLF